MDLYMQIGVLLAMAAMFSLLAAVYGQSAITGLKVKETLTKPSENYSLDSSVTSPTFFVDSRVFIQWAINAKGQRDVYLVYPNHITPDQNLYGAYLYNIEVTQVDADPADRKLVINPQVPSNTNNAYYVEDQTPKTVDYLTLYANTAKMNGKNKMVTVYTFIDSKSSKVSYVCYIK